MTEEKKEPVAPENWDRNKVYHSPSGERVFIYVNGKWTQYIRQDAVAEVIDQAIEEYKKIKSHLQNITH